MQPNAPAFARHGRPSRVRPHARLLLLAGFSAPLVPGALAEPASDFRIEPGSYALESQMIMPHLDEMRRIKSHEQRCIGRGEPEAIFPVLRQPSFIGCALGFEFRQLERFDYVLVCQSARVATGSARIERVRDGLVGTLEVKMGGKNMTFAQRVEATRTGPCEPFQEARVAPPAP